METKSRIEALKADLERQVTETQRQLEILQAKLSVLREVEGSNGNGGQKPRQTANLQLKPGVGKTTLTIVAAGLEGMKALGEFTRPELYDWVQSKYPQLTFPIKGLDKPIRAAFKNNQLKVSQPSVGGQTHSRYKWLNVEADLLK